MFEIKEKPKMVERALLLGAYIPDHHRAEAQSLLEESLGLFQAAYSLAQRLHEPKTFL